MNLEIIGWCLLALIFVVFIVTSWCLSRKEQTSDFVEPITIKEEPDTRLIEFEEYKAGIVSEMTKTR